MKLPEPVAYHFKDDPVRWALPGEGFCFKAALPSDAINVMPLYSEAQVKELLAQADKDFSDGCMVVHLQGADQMRRKYDPVLKIALESLDHSCGDRCNAEYNPCHARLAADTIRKLLG